MSVIKFVFRDFEGALKDPDSIKMSSSDSTFGIVRNDTGAVVIPDGSDMTKVSTGIYEYGWSDVSHGEYGLGLDYKYSVETVYDGITYFDLIESFTGNMRPTISIYATVAELKTHIDYDDQGYTETDAELNNTLEIASRLIDNYCNRSFYCEYPIDVTAVKGVVKSVCLAVAGRLREDPDGLDTGATGETIGRYSYTGNTNEESNINGLTSNEYLQLKPYRRLKRV